MTTKRLDGIAITARFEDIGVGGSLGNKRGYLQASPDGGVDNLWDVQDTYLIGRLDFSPSLDSRPLPPTTVTFHPAYLRARWNHDWGQTERTTALTEVNGEIVCVMWLDFRNDSQHDVTPEVSLRATFSANLRTRHTKKPGWVPAEKRFTLGSTEHLIEATSHSDGAFTVIVADSLGPVVISEPSRASSTWSIAIPPQATRRIRVAVSRSEAAARGVLLDDGFLDRDEASLAAETAGVEIITPDRRIDDANEWAKVNTVRVEHEFLAGPAFTNNPPQDISVVRDMAWFVLGASLFSTEFTGRMLEFIAEKGVEPLGGIVEFMRASIDPASSPPARADQLAMTHLAAAHKTEDFRSLVADPPFDGFADSYELTVKDTTPLFIIAAADQFRVTGDRHHLRRVLPTVLRGAEYLLQQRHDDGLYYTRSTRYEDSTNMWGIASWRNITNGYQILGATTEINSLIAKAFDEIAFLLQSENGVGADEWKSHASELRSAINAELWSERHNAYSLTKSESGEVRDELTSDNVFPLLYSVAEGERARSLAALLNSDRVQAPAGARTVPLGEPEYDSEYGLGLMGGVWPNLSAWIAVAVRDISPAATVTGLVTLSIPVVSGTPAKYGQASPGAFPEWFSGDPDISPLSLGMAASPWMPPTYTWAVVRGLLHLDHDLASLTFGESLPALPDGWEVWGVRRIAVGDRLVTIIRSGDRVYASEAVAGAEAEILAGDVSDEVTVDGRAIALADETQLVVLTDANGSLRFRGHEFSLPSGPAPKAIVFDLARASSSSNSSSSPQR